jgi:hypothetical protein
VVGCDVLCSCRSADIWVYVRLCVVLELAVYDGDMIGCIVARIVIIVWFYQYVLVGSWCR